MTKKMSAQYLLSFILFGYDKNPESFISNEIFSFLLLRGKIVDAICRTVTESPQRYPSFPTLGLKIIFA